MQWSSLDRTQRSGCNDRHKEQGWKQQWATGSWSQPPRSAVTCETARSSRLAATEDPALPCALVRRWARDTLSPGPDAHVSHHRLSEPEAAAADQAASSGAATATPHRRNPSDVDVPEIGDEVAAARALRRLADRLLGVASDDIEAIEGHGVRLRPPPDGFIGTNDL